MTENLIVYSAAGCVWWDSIDKVAKKPNGLPCCPHCGSVLYQIAETEWWSDVDRYEKVNQPGYRKFVEWWRGKCFPSFAAAKAQYGAETGIIIT